MEMIGLDWHDPEDDILPEILPLTPVVLDDGANRNMADSNDAKPEEEDHLTDKTSHGYIHLAAMFDVGFRRSLANALSLALDGYFHEGRSCINNLRVTIHCFLATQCRVYEKEWSKLYNLTKSFIMCMWMILKSKETSQKMWMCPVCFDLVELGPRRDLSRWNCDGCLRDSTHAERAMILSGDNENMQKALKILTDEELIPRV